VIRLIFILLFVSLSAPVFSDVYVQGYYRSDGTYVRPHYRSDPNRSGFDLEGASQYLNSATRTMQSLEEEKRKEELHQLQMQQMQQDKCERVQINGKWATVCY
jgi:hypothetical protein